MATLFHDDFDSASAVTLEAHAPNIGTSYTKLTSGASATIAANAGTAVFKDGARIAYTLNGVNSADVVFTSLMQWSASADVLGFWFRRSGDSGPGLALNVQEGSNAALYYYNGSTYTPLTNGSGGTGTLGSLPSDGRFSQVTLTVSMIGNRLICQIGSNTPFVDFTTNGQVTGAGNFQLEILSGNNAILQWLDVTDGGSGSDTTAPVLTSATGASSSGTTATVGATTNEGNGTMYAIVSTSATLPSVPQIQAGQSSSGGAAAWASGATTVSSNGAKTFNATGLVAGTTYYAYFQHKDAAGNNSTVIGSTSFTTPSGSDTTPPTLSSASATATGTTSASGSVSTNEGNGTLYYLATTNATETAATVKASGATKAVSATGAQAVTFSSLSPGTTYYAHYVHRDASGNDSAVANTAAFTTTASGTIISEPLKDNTGTLLVNTPLAFYAVYNDTTGALVVRKTGLTTNSQAVVSFSDAALVAGTTYRHDWETNDGKRRMPRKAAT